MFLMRCGRAKNDALDEEGDRGVQEEEGRVM